MQCDRSTARKTSGLSSNSALTSGYWCFSVIVSPRSPFIHGVKCISFQALVVFPVSCEPERWLSFSYSRHRFDANRR